MAKTKSANYTATRHCDTCGAKKPVFDFSGSTATTCRACLTKAAKQSWNEQRRDDKPLPGGW